MARVLCAALATAVVVALTAAPAGAGGGVAVSVVSFNFDPDPVTVQQGTSVTWTNNAGGITQHSSTQDSPLALWNSMPMDPGENFSFQLLAAGTYPYHCTVHPLLMKGTVKVPLIVDATTGDVDTIFTFTLTFATQAGFVYDVQKKVGKGAWKDWKTELAGPTVKFNPNKTGTFRFRSRLHESASGDTSDYSPKKKIVVS
jgi:plastocyanin